MQQPAMQPCELAAAAAATAAASAGQRVLPWAVMAELHQPEPETAEAVAPVAATRNAGKGEPAVALVPLLQGSAVQHLSFQAPVACRCRACPL